MPLFSFKISSKVDLARCKALFKPQERLSFPVSPSFWQQLTAMKPMYGICWDGEKSFYLTRWRFVVQKYSPAGYRQGIEMVAKVEGTNSEPLFILETKKGELGRILGLCIGVFIMFGLVFGLMSQLSASKVSLATWFIFACAPLLFSIGVSFDFIMNAILCRNFLKRLVG